METGFYMTIISIQVFRFTKNIDGTFEYLEMLSSMDHRSVDHFFKTVQWTFHLSVSINSEMLTCLCSVFCLLEFVNVVKL